jgi:hypothetical protein
MTRPTSRIMLNKFDMGVYRGHSQAQGALTPVRENHSLPFIARCKSLQLLSLVLLLLLLMAIPMPSYGATYSVDQLRLYLHSRVLNFNEFICMDKIIMKESRYNYLARNGSHYGIGQMRSKHYQSKDPYTQIDLTIAYTHKRYVTMCNALAFHKRHGYY